MGFKTGGEIKVLGRIMAQFGAARINNNNVVIIRIEIKYERYVSGIEPILSIC